MSPRQRQGAALGCAMPFLPGRSGRIIWVAIASYVLSFAALVLLGHDRGASRRHQEFTFTYGGMGKDHQYRLGRGERVLHHFYLPLYRFALLVGVPIGHLNSPLVIESEATGNLAGTYRRGPTYRDLSEQNIPRPGRFPEAVRPDKRTSGPARAGELAPAREQPKQQAETDTADASKGVDGQEAAMDHPLLGYEARYREIAKRMNAIQLTYRDQPHVLARINRSQADWEKYLRSHLAALHPTARDNRVDEARDACRALAAVPLMDERLNVLQAWQAGVRADEPCRGDIRPVDTKGDAGVGMVE